MTDLFDTPDMAAGYAHSRPAVHPRIIERVRARLRLTSPLDNALDVGCGAGLSTRVLQPIARHCLGVDPSKAMIRYGRTSAPGAAFAAGRAEALPIRSCCVDLIAAAGSLNFADLDLFFPEAARVLRPNGVLVIYDFSEGRSFSGSTSLDAWYASFWQHYPPPPNFGHDLSPETLRPRPCALRWAGHEDFEVGLELTPAFYLDYIMTETNVALAVHDGVPERDIRAWCAATLAPVFGGQTREVLFRGYIAYFTQPGTTVETA